MKGPAYFVSFLLHHIDARGRSQRGERRSDDACQHLEGQPPYLLVLHRLPPFFSNLFPPSTFLFPLKEPISFIEKG